MFYPIIRTHTVKLIWSFVSYFFERFKWKKLNYGKIFLKNSLVATGNGGHIGKKQQILFPQELITELRYSLGLNCILIVFMFSTLLQTRFSLSWLGKIRQFQKFDTLQRRTFCNQIFNKNILSKILTNGFVETFIITLT